MGYEKFHKYLIPLNLSVTEDGLTAKSSLTLNFFVEFAYYLPHNSYMIIICIYLYQVTVKTFTWFTNRIGALRVHMHIPGN